MQRKELPEHNEHWVRVGHRMSRFLYWLGYDTMSISRTKEELGDRRTSEQASDPKDAAQPTSSLG